MNAFLVFPEFKKILDQEQQTFQLIPILAHVLCLVSEGFPVGISVVIDERTDQERLIDFLLSCYSEQQLSDPELG